MYLRQSTSQVIKVGPFLDETDGRTAETALTLTNTDFRLSKDGGNFASSSTGSGTHDENGIYDKTLSTTDTNTVGELVVHVDESGALPVTHRYWVLEEAIYDALFGASANGFASGGGVVVQSVDADAITSDSIEDGSILGTKLGTGLQSLAYLGPYGPGIYLNPFNGTGGTVFGTSGTAVSPVLTIADALTLVANLDGPQVIYIQGGASITLGGTAENITFVGLGDMEENSINLNSNDVDGSAFINLKVTGTQGGTGQITVRDGVLDALVGLYCRADNCAITGNITVDASGSTFSRCYSAVASNGTPELTFVAGADVSFRSYSGELQINSMASGDTMEMEADGAITIGATCTGGTLILRGMLSITDSASGAVTVTKDAVVNQTDGVSTTVAGEITFTVGSTNLSPVTCSTNLLTQGFTAKDIFKNRTIEWLSGSNLYGAVSLVHAYDESTGDLTFNLTPNSISPVAGDTARLL